MLITIEERSTQVTTHNLVELKSGLYGKLIVEGEDISGFFMVNVHFILLMLYSDKPMSFIRVYIDLMHL
ncbi:hypothetical protein H4J39_12060 [Colwellia sp. Bg11-12]|nr:hypothetical protein [Colwellia sp. Bg11-12]